MRLGYLMFADNSAYCSVVENTPNGITTDLEKKTWQYKLPGFQTTKSIGSSRYLGEWRGGVIGVYDLDDIKHVNSMIHAAIEAQRNGGDAD